MSTEIAHLLVRSPDICGGRLRIDGTRITVNQMAVWYKEGSSPEEIADQYPHLTLAHIYTALAYYHANREEVEADLAAEKAEADSMRTELSMEESNNPNNPSVEDWIVGTWDWKETIDFQIAMPPPRTPQSEGYTEQRRFLPDGQVEFYSDGRLTGTYPYRTESRIEPREPQRALSDTISYTLGKNTQGTHEGRDAGVQ